MVSKNNRVKRLEETAERQSRFSIRKLTIGAASVLIGTTFWLGTQAGAAQADTTNAKGEDQTPHEAQASKTEMPEINSDTKVVAEVTSSNNQKDATAQNNNSDSQNNSSVQAQTEGAKKVEKSSASENEQNLKQETKDADSAKKVEKKTTTSATKKADDAAKKETTKQTAAKDDANKTVKSGAEGVAKAAENLSKDNVKGAVEASKQAAGTKVKVDLNKLNLTAAGLKGQLSTDKTLSPEQALNIAKTANAAGVTSDNQKLTAEQAKRLKALFGASFVQENGEDDKTSQEDPSVKDVSDWNGLNSALSNSTVKNINLTQDINSGWGSIFTGNTLDVSHDVTINGNNHEINLGSGVINNNAKLNLKNVTINGSIMGHGEVNVEGTVTSNVDYSNNHTMNDSQLTEQIGNNKPGASTNNWKAANIEASKVNVETAAQLNINRSITGDGIVLVDGMAAFQEDGTTFGSTYATNDKGTVNVGINSTLNINLKDANSASRSNEQGSNIDNANAAIRALDNGHFVTGDSAKVTINAGHGRALDFGEPFGGNNTVQMNTAWGPILNWYADRTNGHPDNTSSNSRMGYHKSDFQNSNNTVTLGDSTQLTINSRDGILMGNRSTFTTGDHSVVKINSVGNGAGLLGEAFSKVEVSPHSQLLLNSDGKNASGHWSGGNFIGLGENGQFRVEHDATFRYKLINRGNTESNPYDDNMNIISLNSDSRPEVYVGPNATFDGQSDYRDYYGEIFSFPLGSSATVFQIDGAKYVNWEKNAPIIAHAGAGNLYYSSGAGLIDATGQKYYVFKWNNGNLNDNNYTLDDSTPNSMAQSIKNFENSSDKYWTDIEHLVTKYSTKGNPSEWRGHHVSDGDYKTGTGYNPVDKKTGTPINNYNVGDGDPRHNTGFDPLNSQRLVLVSNVLYTQEDKSNQVTDPYKVIIKYDDSLAPGEVRLDQKGQNGLTRTTETTYYVVDPATGKKEIYKTAEHPDGTSSTSVVLTRSQDEIISIGKETATVNYVQEVKDNQGNVQKEPITDPDNGDKAIVGTVTENPFQLDKDGNILFDDDGNALVNKVNYTENQAKINRVEQLNYTYLPDKDEWQAAYNNHTNLYKTISKKAIQEAAESGKTTLNVAGPTYDVYFDQNETNCETFGKLTVNYYDEQGNQIYPSNDSLHARVYTPGGQIGSREWHSSTFLKNADGTDTPLTDKSPEWGYLYENGSYRYGMEEVPNIDGYTFDYIRNDSDRAEWTRNNDGVLRVGHVVKQAVVGDQPNSNGINGVINLVFKKNPPKETTGSVVYYDDTSKTTLRSDSLSGNIGQSINYTTNDKIKSFEDKGYELVSNQFKDGNEIFNADSSKNNFVVHLKHHVDHITPGTPGDGYDRTDLEKTITRNIKYVDQQGNKVAPDHNDSFTFTAEGYYDKVTKKFVNINPDGSIKDQNGQLTWNANSHNFDKIVSPSVDRMHVVSVTPTDQADGNDVKAVTINHGSENINVVVRYANNGTEVRNAHDLPASQTTKFVDENGNELADSVVQKSSFHYSGDTYDATTGDKIKDGSWNPESHIFNSVDAPVIQGYVAESRTAAGMTATVNDPNVENEVVYHKIGKIIPVDNITKQPIPGADQPQYQNDQNDPTKVVPNENIPDVKDYLPVTPGQQVTPEDPTKDTEVPYKQVIHGTIKYIDDTTKGTLKTDKFQGFIGDQIDYTTAGIIKGYEDSGYKLVSNNFKDGNETYARTGNDFEVHLVHTYSPVTPKTPHGLDPKELTKDVKETIHYIGAGDKTPKDNVQTSQWTRQFTWDNVDKKIVPNGELDRDWSITPGQKTNYDEVKSPEVEGYHPDKETVSSTPVTQTDIDVTVTYSQNGQEVRDTKDVPATQTTKFVDENGKELADSVVQNSNFHYSGDTYDKFTGKKIKDGSWNEESHKFNSVDAPVINGYVAESRTADGLTATVDHPDVTNQIVYHKIGKIIPVDPDHNPIPDAPTPDYQNDPKDPTKVTPNEPTPKVPGWTTTTPDVTPTDPTKDTQVVYKQSVEGTIKYIDDTAKTTLDSENLPSGYVGDKINYTTAGKIADYEKQGYKLVSNDFKDGNETYAKTGNDFEVHFVHNYVPVTPKTPHGVDPSLVQKDVKETVKYVGAGDKTPKDVVQTSQWTRTLTMDQVTGQIVPNGKLDTDWAIAPGEKTNYDEVKTPDIEGYHADKATIPATKVIQQDITEIVTYAPNGTEVRNNRDVPASQTTKFVDDNGNEIADTVVQTSNFHYSGDTYDKVTGKVITTGSWNEESHKFNSVNAPVIIGYVADAKTADGLTATIDHPNVENKIVYHKIGKIIPVDPNHDPIPDAPTPDYQNDPKDPTKVVPNEPTPDVPNYTTTTKTVTPTDPTKNTQVVYNQVVEGTVTYYDDTTNQVLGNVDTIKGYVGDKINYSTQGRIDNYESKGYKLVSDGFTTSDQLFKKSHNYFEVHFVHTYSPVNPKNPNPKVAPSDYTKSYTSTVHYTGAGAQTPADNVQTSTWTRTLTIDNVTGNIIPGGQYDTDWAPDKKSYDAVPTPNVPDYQPDKTEVPAKNTEQRDLYETVTYSPVAKDQKARVQYIDLDENDKLIDQSPELTGKAGDTINYSTADKIKELTNKGYELANDGFSAGAAFDNVDGNEQIFKVTFHHGHQPVNPQNPGKPGEPINPNDPDGPKYPAESDQVTKNITRTIHYEGAGNSTPSDIKQTVNFTANGVLDKVTGQWITPLTWSGDQTVAAAKTPVVKGYYVTGVDKDSSDNVNVDSATIKRDGSDYTVTVHYAPLGKIVPVDPSGKPIPNAPTPQYPNDPTDPTKVTPDEPTPSVPGWKTDTPTVTPKDPGKDTTVVYKQAVNGGIKYIDDTTNTQLDSDNFNGYVGDKIDYTTAGKIKGFEAKGYQLVSNSFNDGNETYQQTGNQFEVHFEHTYTPITPKNPHGQNPNDLTKEVKETVHYTGAGEQTPPDNVQTSKWTRNETLDNVTGQVVKGGKYDTDWAIAPGEKTTYDQVNSPVVEGYHADISVVKATPVQPKDISVTVTYAPNGQQVVNNHIVPAEQTTRFVDENGVELAPDQKQDFTFEYSGDTVDTYTGKVVKEGTWNENSHKFAAVDAPVINGYVATVKSVDGETATVDNPFVENQIVYKKIGKIIPVDPNHNPIPNAPTPEYKNDPSDPTKVIPNEVTPTVPDWKTDTPTVTPSDPTTDTTVVYYQTADGSIKYIDDTTNTQLDSDNFSGHVGDKIDYTTAGKIKGFEAKGYELVSNNFNDGNETYQKTGNQFEVHFKHTYTPITPKNPHGQNPNDLTKEVKETIHYVGTPSAIADNVQTSKWTRNETLDNVTGEVVQGGKYDTDWAIAPGEKTTYDQVDSPVVEGYHPDITVVKATPVQQNDINVVVTYAPNGQQITNRRDVPASQTTKFVDENGNEIASEQKQTFTFSYSGDTVDTYTNKVVKEGSWNENSHTFTSVNAPVINGYVATVKSVDGMTATVDNPDVVNQIVYKKLGKIIPVDPDHNPIPNVPQPPYENNPSDPTTVTPNEPTPNVPGWKTDTPTVTPTDPTKDTEVVYKQAVNGGIKYIDDTTNTQIDSDNFNGYVGDKINYSTAAKIKGFEAKGYELVSDNFTSSDQTFKKDGNNYEVHFKHTYSPVNPKNPNPKVSPDQYTQTVTSTVHYIGAGANTPNDNVQTVTWIRSFTIDNVTGNIVPGGQYDQDWTPSKTTYDEVVTPTIPGYTPDKTSVPAKTVTRESQYEVVTYTPVAKDQKAVVNYIDLDNHNAQIATSGVLTGKAGDVINYSTADQIKAFEDQGYVLANDGFPAGAAFDNVDGNTQTFEVTFHHGQIPVNPKNPHDVDKNLLEKDVKETVHYVGAGNATPSDSVQTSKWGRTLTYDQVTKQLVPNGKYDTDWAIEPGQKTIYDQVNTPVVNGFHADMGNVPATSVTQDDITKTVTYSPNGKIIPVDPNHNPIPGVDQPQYPTNPSDPTTVTPNEPVPTIPGYTPSVPTVTPTDPGKDTEVIYTPIPVAKDQNAIVNYIDADENNTQIATSGNLSGKAGTVINYSTAKEIKALEDKGYVLEYDGFSGQNAKYDNDDNTTQTFLVIMKHGHTTVTPQKPGKPGEPINPENPNGPKYPDGTDISNLKRTGTQTIHYNGAGANTPADNVENFDFTRNITFDNVTGKIIDGGTWNVNSHKFDSVVTPVVNGYHADQIMAGGTIATPDDLSHTVTVNYSPNGKIIPVDPNHNPIPNAPTPQYPTDPKDPTDVTPNEPVPSIPGYTPSVPTVTPQDPGKDTEVIYNPVPVAKDQNATIRYIDQDNNNSVITSANVSGKAGATIDYSTANEIQTLEDRGYELVYDGFTGQNAKFDNDDNTTQTFDVVLKHGQTTITPQKPGKPGEPINPKYPDGPKWPTGTDKNSLIKTGTQTVHYQGAGTATPNDSVTTIEFDHSEVVDKVTGKIIADNGWTPSSQTYKQITSPEVPGYTPSQTVVGGDTIKESDNNLNRSYTVTYTENQAPVTPDQPTQPTQASQETTPAPVLPENPTQPTQASEENVTPHGQDVPAEPEQPKAPENVRPHAQKAPAPVKNVHVQTVTPHATSVAKPEKRAELPQTGDDKNVDEAAAVAGGLAAMLSLVGLAGVKKRKN